MITDAQVHLFDANTPSRRWPTDGRAEPVTKLPSFGGEHMLGAMKAIGIDRAVIVPPVWAGDHNLTALEVANAYPDQFAVMGRIDPWADDTPARLESWLDHPGMLGIRVSSRWGIHLGLFEKMANDQDLGWFWDACERLEIPVMCLTRDGIAGLEPIVSAHPRLRIIIDHLGMTEGSTLDLAFRHLDTLVALARSENVHMKVSMAPNHSHEPYPFTDVQPILRRIYDAYGARRMLWAADMTQLSKNTYAECLRLWQEGLPFLSASDRDLILGGAVAEVLPWPEPSV